jgi:ATP-dependent DNA helicase Rep
VLVDEYQDTNATQYELLKLLVGERGRFTAVGDDDQSIYGWRGATLDNLKKLPQDFPQLKVIKLEQNYRSTSAILRAANNVIGPNPKLFPKTLFSELGEGEPVRVVDADNEEHEAERAVARIQGLRAAANPPPDWKRLRHPVPRQPPGQAVREGAAQGQHPVQGVGRPRAFLTAPKSATCAPGSGCGSTATTTRPFCAPSPRPSAASATPRWGSSAPLRGPPHQPVRRAVFPHAARHPAPARAGRPARVWPLHQRPGVPRAPDPGGRGGARLSDRMAAGDRLRKAPLRRRGQREGGRRALEQRAGVLRLDGAARGGQIDDTAGATTQMETKSLLEVAQNIALLSTLSEREKDQDVVTLSTLHASKGLEWPHVMLAGVTEGMLPFKLDDDDGRQQKLSDDTIARLQEERRLMYVGITRAQRTLAVSWTKKRKKGREMVAAQPSRFIAEMALSATTAREDPREKLKALRAEFARKAQERAEPPVC